MASNSRICRNSFVLFVVSSMIGVGLPLSPIDSGDDLKIVNWVHVPKAGGTALTHMMKKVVCTVNPSLAPFNPCCRPKLCLHHQQCYAAVGACPLVTAVGRHTTNMAMATASACCATDLGHSITSQFLQFSFPGLQQFQGNQAGHDALEIWPVADRIAFFLATGISREELLVLIEKRQYPPWVLAPHASPQALLDAGARKLAQSFAPQGPAAAAAAASPSSPSSPSSSAAFEQGPGGPEGPDGPADPWPLLKLFRARSFWRARRLGQCAALVRLRAAADVGRDEFVPEECSAKFSLAAMATPTGARGAQGRPYRPEPRHRVGDYSLTMLRHPFPRALSGATYKGHNPNYDSYDLRPGLWLHPAHKPRGYPDFSFYDYVTSPEYQNTLVKMFGLSRDCPAARQCDARATEEDALNRSGVRNSAGCSLTGQCHAYRNASLAGAAGEAALAAAQRILSRFRFVGLQEAYNSSVLLLAATYGIPNVDPNDAHSNDFEKARVAIGQGAALKCKSYHRRFVAGGSPDACRATIKANALDARLFEVVQRQFCAKLDAHGLRDPRRSAHSGMVEAELRAARLCDPGVDLSDPDAYCAALETPHALAVAARDRQKCERHVPHARQFMGDFTGYDAEGWPASVPDAGPWQWHSSSSE